MGTKMDGGIADGAVATHAEVLPAHTFGVSNTQGNVIQPLRCLHRERHGHVDHFRFLHFSKEFVIGHAFWRRPGKDTAPGSLDFHEGDRHDTNPGAFIL